MSKLPIGRFLRFGVVGFSGLFVDLAVFSLLRENTDLNWRLCTAISIEAAIVNNFLWNDAWTFADLAQQNQSWQARLQRFVKFNSVCLLGACLQYILMEGLLKLPIVSALPELMARNNSFAADNKADEYVSKIIAIAVVTCWNFWINLKLSWRTPKPPQ
ncbi:MAG: GtrA family protein [Phormidesmis sp.]